MQKVSLEKCLIAYRLSDGVIEEYLECKIIYDTRIEVQFYIETIVMLWQNVSVSNLISWL